VFTRTLQPPIPKTFPVQLHATQTDAFTTGTSLFRTIGVLEYLALQPLYISKLYAMYRYSVVTSVTVEARFTNNQAAGSSVFAMAVMPFSDVASTNVDEISEMPGARYDTVSNQNGMNKSVLKKTVNAQDVFGAPYFTRDYWINTGQSVSAVPIDTQEPVLVVGIADFIGGNPLNGVVQYFITYNCVFFDLQTAT